MRKSLEWLVATSERRLALALIALCCLLYIPLAGNYGMWDPWETHYGEVARQMLERHDYVSQWWPGSPQDRNEFFSKPVLTFWLMAMSMKLFGIEGWGSHPAEMVDSWRVEWAVRLPQVLLSIAAIFSVFVLVQRLAGKRAAILSSVVLATSAQWALISRQAMTDMPFVAPMTIALALGGLALLLPEEEREKELPRRTATLLGRQISWPHARSFYAFVALYALTVLPQLIIISIQVQVHFRIGSRNVTLLGLVPMLLYFAVFFGSLYGCALARNKRQVYLFNAWVLCGIASLAKGPAGLALPALVLAFYLLLSGRWREIFTKLEILRGPALFIATAFPWYHAMLIRHGAAFWNEFIGDNYVHRAAGRHGDRGTFEYYVQWAGYGMFPWTGVAAVASLLSFKTLRDASPKRGLTAFAIIWFVVQLTVMSMVNTKFHHYILPALPALAILVGCFLDDVIVEPKRIHAVALLLVGAPITFLAGRDLAAFPPRILWLFNYDYVNMPGTGRPWPTVAMYGDRYEYGNQLFVFAVVATLVTIAIAVWAYLAREKPAPEGESPLDVEPTWAAAFIGGAIVMLALAIMFGPASPNGKAPVIGRWDWLKPTLCMLPFAIVPPLLLKGSRTARPRNLAPWALALVGVVFTAFLVDKILIELSPHWAQKHVIASYYANRKSDQEPLIAWQLYWRGENFYTRNEIYRSTNPLERTIFLGDHNAEKMQTYFNTHRGRRVFFVVERIRYESLRALLPADAKQSLQIVDDSNNKIYLAVAQL